MTSPPVGSYLVDALVGFVVVHVVVFAYVSLRAVSEVLTSRALLVSDTVQVIVLIITMVAVVGLAGLLGRALSGRRDWTWGIAAGALVPTLLFFIDGNPLGSLLVSAFGAVALLVGVRYGSSGSHARQAHPAD